MPYSCGKDEEGKDIWSEPKCNSAEDGLGTAGEWCWEWCRPRPYDCADGSRTEETCDFNGENCGYWCKDAKNECSW